MTVRLQIWTNTGLVVATTIRRKVFAAQVIVSVIEITPNINRVEDEGGKKWEEET